MVIIACVRVGIIACDKVGILFIACENRGIIVCGREGTSARVNYMYIYIFFIHDDETKKHIFTGIAIAGVLVTPPLRGVSVVM